jgi:hypothetical protein
MENQVLILEPDPDLAARLEAALKLQGQYLPQRADSLRAACRMLAEQKYGLAIIPAEEASRRAQSMRALQPDLPIVLTISKEGKDSHAADLQKFQGHLTLDNLENELPAILIQARWQKDQQIAQSGDSWLGEEPFTRKRLRDLCRSIQLDGRVQQVILSKGQDFVACGWIDDEDRAREVVKWVGETWDGSLRSSQIQFYQIGQEETASLLYTRLVGSYLLTLVARHDAPLPVIRSQSDRLVAELTGKPVDLRSTSNIEDRIKDTATLIKEGPRITYVLVIWPIESLPGSLQKFITNTIEEIARDADCDLKKLLVQEDRLQLLVELPPGRPSSWFAKLVKDGVKKRIQSQFGVSLELWASGFYASQSDRPLSETELSLLKRTQ